MCQLELMELLCILQSFSRYWDEEHANCVQSIRYFFFNSGRSS